MTQESGYLKSIRQQFLYYKSLGDKAMAQLKPEMLFIQPNAESNSIAMIIQHMHGNMMSRWTNFLTSDGEKEWRKRDEEFEPVLTTELDVMQKWEEGWACLVNALDQVTEDLLSATIFIRNEPLTVTAALNRQLAHYPYHVGQIVFYAKHFVGNEFKTLSIARNQSREFNAKKMSK